MKPGTSEAAIDPSGAAHCDRIHPSQTIQELPGCDSQTGAAHDPYRRECRREEQPPNAFLFLHGIGRGYSLAEIFGDNSVGGERVWSGTRGGVREVAYHGSDSFELVVALRLPPENQRTTPSHTESRSPLPSRSPKHPTWSANRCTTRILFGGRMHAKGETGFQTEVPESAAKGFDRFVLPQRGTARKSSSRTYPPKVPILFQISEDIEGNGREARTLSRFVLHELKDFRFLDLSPTQMRIPSHPGQTTLGDQGENLSSVLKAICADASRKQILLEWVRKLTPMDVDDLIFDQDAAGRLLLGLVEKCGRSVSALSASDGTLRFLAILAALMGPEPASFYFIEELETGFTLAAQPPGRSDRKPDQAAWHSGCGYESFATVIAVSQSGVARARLARLPASRPSRRGDQTHRGVTTAFHLPSDGACTGFSML